MTETARGPESLRYLLSPSTEGGQPDLFRGRAEWIVRTCYLASMDAGREDALRAKEPLPLPVTTTQQLLPSPQVQSIICPWKAYTAPKANTDAKWL